MSLIVLDFLSPLLFNEAFIIIASFFMFFYSFTYNNFTENKKRCKIQRFFGLLFIHFIHPFLSLFIFRPFLFNVFTHTFSKLHIYRLFSCPTLVKDRKGFQEKFKK